MSERLPRRGLFAVLMSISLALFGLLGRRRQPAPALPAAAEAEVEECFAFAPALPEAAEGELERNALVGQLMRHTEAMQKMLNESHEQVVHSLSEQLVALQEQNNRMAASQYELLDLQQKVLDEQAARERQLVAEAATNGGRSLPEKT